MLLTNKNAVIAEGQDPLVARSRVSLLAKGRRSFSPAAQPRRSPGSPTTSLLPGGAQRRRK